jgi:uncharacterized membrane protein YfcA
MFSTFTEPGIPPTVFWSFCALAVLFQGISKSGFAGGLGILSVPLMALVMPVDKTAAVLLPVLILCDFNAIYYHRKNVVWRHVWRIFLPSTLGILAGAALWWYIGKAGVEAYEQPLKHCVGVIALLFAGYIFAKEMSMGWARRHRMGNTAAWILGIAAGFTSTLIHAAGPIVNLYLFSQGMGKSLFVGTVAWTFTLINLTKLPFYVGAGLVDTRVLGFDIFLLPLIPIGSWLGHWMHHRVPEKPFNWVVLCLTLIAAIQLVFNVPLVQMALSLLRD